MSVHVIFGSDGGVTKGIASRIAKQVNGRSIDIKEAQIGDFENCSLLILGCPTYGVGDLQSDWEENIGLLDEADLTGKTVALFGTGDQGTYPDSFVDAIGILYDRVTGKGAKVVGFTDTAGYDFSNSLALRDGQFVGLALDEDTQSGKTNKRIASWVETLK